MIPSVLISVQPRFPLLCQWPFAGWLTGQEFALGRDWLIAADAPPQVAERMNCSG
jgi:hypothetical protein